MKRIKIKPPYIALTQQRLCCVPCAIQWILLRRGLKLVEQETIGRELDLIVRPKYKHLFISKVKAIKRKTKKFCYGTHDTDGSKMNKFFRKHKIPLKTKKIFYSEIKNIKYAAKIIADNLKKGNDVMFITYMSVIDSKKKFGHALLVNDIVLNKKPKVVVGDPDFFEKKFWQADLGKIIRGMSEKFDTEERGIFVFTKRKI
ncbi:hypothetical protein KAU40_01040 [Candidatus Parcubacteria bacterium]|nr:hypothetical protein [Candidatus Parcubacteria bacterium]